LDLYRGHGKWVSVV